MEVDEKIMQVQSDVLNVINESQLPLSVIVLILENILFNARDSLGKLKESAIISKASGESNFVD